MKLASRKVRLRAVWLLVVPFLVFARPTPQLLLAGGALALMGAGIRAWAAGYIHKDRALSTGGPYAHTRNPLYLGSLLIGLGVTLAGGRWIFVVLFLAFFFWIYGKTMRKEARVLEGKFGEAYRTYASRVPLLVPRPMPWRGPPGAEASFSLERWRRNREYEALLGVVAGFGFLALRMVLF